MLAIRLARVGKNKRAQFKIVLQEHTVAPGGRHVEILGSYDPHLKKSTFKAERIQYWISQGAKTSDTVHNLLISNNVIQGEKRKVKLPTKKEAEAGEMPASEKKDEKTAAPSKEAEVKKTEEKPVKEKVDKEK
jgi:small subunit ribosomal protein S16